MGSFILFRAFLGVCLCGGMAMVCVLKLVNLSTCFVEIRIIQLLLLTK